jgi:hypothetical protein
VAISAKGNFALWQIWPRVFGLSDFLFLSRRKPHVKETARVRRIGRTIACVTTAAGNQAARVGHTGRTTGAVRTADATGPYNCQ